MMSGSGCGGIDTTIAHTLAAAGMQGLALTHFRAQSST
jgi:hypothetical protein